MASSFKLAPLQSTAHPAMPASSKMLSTARMLRARRVAAEEAQASARALAIQRYESTAGAELVKWVKTLELDLERVPMVGSPLLHGGAIRVSKATVAEVAQVVGWTSANAPPFIVALVGTPDPRCGLK